MILKPTMELKWFKKEIVIEGSSLDKAWATTTGKYEKALHQKFIDDKGGEHWKEVQTDGNY